MASNCNCAGGTGTGPERVIPKSMQLLLAWWRTQGHQIPTVVAFRFTTADSRRVVQRLMNIPYQMFKPDEVIRFLRIRITGGKDRSKGRDLGFSVGGRERRKGRTVR